MRWDSNPRYQAMNPMITKLSAGIAVGTFIEKHPLVQFLLKKRRAYGMLVQSARGSLAPNGRDAAADRGPAGDC